MQPSPEAVRAAPGRPKRRVLEAPYIPTPSLALAQEWAETFDEGDRRAFFTVTGAHQDRAEFYARLGASREGHQTWLTTSVLTALQDAVERAWLAEDAKPFMPAWWPPVTAGWGLLWGLVAAPDFVVEEPLREMVDRSVSVFHTFFLALWEIRFTLQEKGDLPEAAGLITSLGTWLRGQPLDALAMANLTRLGIARRLVHENERLDVLCFLLTLAAQNGLVSRLHVVFDGIERADRVRLRELYTVLQTCGRWTRLPGMPLGLLLGWNADGAGLGKANAKLVNYIIQGVA